MGPWDTLGPRCGRIRAQGSAQGRCESPQNRRLKEHHGTHRTMVHSEGECASFTPERAQHRSSGASLTHIGPRMAQVCA